MKQARNFTVPDPATRVSAALYVKVRTWLLENDPDASEMLAWSESDLAPPPNAEKMAREIVWIILCAGRSAQAARTLEARVWEKINVGKSAFEAFGYRAKAAAIDRAWCERDQDFAALNLVLAKGDDEALLDWCAAIPFVGGITKFQLCKNWGRDFCKPDLWLARLAGIPDRPLAPAALRFRACMALCEPLAAATGDRISTVDSAIWLACNKRVLVVGPDAGAIEFIPGGASRRSIYEAADA